MMTQTWNQVLFIHYPVPAARLASLIPSPLELDTYDGTAWIGVLPFYTTNAHVRGLPSLPYVSSFPEVNVRTYVRYGSRAGVFFFSLDTNRSLLVEGARWFYGLPYLRSSIEMTRSTTKPISLSLQRTDPRAGRASLSLEYKPISSSSIPSPGSLDHWLTERYSLYVKQQHRFVRGDIHHAPWRLSKAEAEIRQNTILPPSIHPILAESKALYHYAEYQKTYIWPPVKIKE